MKMPMRIIAMLTAAVALPATAAHPNLKTGIWESTTIQTHASGIIMPDLSALPPEKREQVRKAFTEIQTRQQSPRTSKHCMTAKDLENMDALLSKNGRSRCKSKLVHTSGDIWSGTEQCADKHMAETATWQYRVVDSGHVSGTAHMTITQGTQIRKMEMKVDSRWLGPECGSVR